MGIPPSMRDDGEVCERPVAGARIRMDFFVHPKRVVRSDHAGLRQRPSMFPDAYRGHLLESHHLSQRTAAAAETLRQPLINRSIP